MRGNSELSTSLAGRQILHEILLISCAMERLYVINLCIDYRWLYRSVLQAFYLISRPTNAGPQRARCISSMRFLRPRKIVSISRRNIFHSSLRKWYTTRHEEFNPKSKLRIIRIFIGRKLNSRILLKIRWNQLDIARAS